jgi:hypothetical protein
LSQREFVIGQEFTSGVRSFAPLLDQPSEEIATKTRHSAAGNCKRTQPRTHSKRCGVGDLFEDLNESAAGSKAYCQHAIGLQRHMDSLLIQRILGKSERLPRPSDGAFFLKLSRPLPGIPNNWNVAFLKNNSLKPL